MQCKHKSFPLFGTLHHFYKLPHSWPLKWKMKHKLPLRKVQLLKPKGTTHLQQLDNNKSDNVDGRNTQNSWKRKIGDYSSLNCRKYWDLFILPFWVWGSVYEIIELTWISFFFLFLYFWNVMKAKYLLLLYVYRKMCLVLAMLPSFVVQYNAICCFLFTSI